MVQNQLAVDVRHREAAPQVLEHLLRLVGQVDGLGESRRRGYFNHRQGAIASCRDGACRGLAACRGGQRWNL
jgi:hypothetical protein